MCFSKNYYRCKVCTRKAYGDEQEDQKSKDKLDIIINGQSMAQSQVPTMKEI